jgi:hypothetical protein
MRVADVPVKVPLGVVKIITPGVLPFQFGDTLNVWGNDTPSR